MSLEIAPPSFSNHSRYGTGLSFTGLSYALILGRSHVNMREGSLMGSRLFGNLSAPLVT
jgi:hypothetical protein